MRMRAFFFIGSASLLLGIFAVPGNSQESPVSVPAAIRSIIKGSCSVAGCHQGKYPAAGLNFEAEAFLSSVLDVPSKEVDGLKIVDTREPEKSYLLAKIKGESWIVGKRMPLNRPPLTGDQIEEIETWVQGLKKTDLENGQPASWTQGKRPFLFLDTTAAQPAARSKGFTRPAFWGTRLVNLPTTTTPGKREFLFRVSHRFLPAISDGWDYLYGLDGPAFILLSFGYGISDNLALTFGRTRFYQEWELSADWLLFEQGKKSSLPFSAVLHAGGSLVSQDKPPGADWSGRFRLSALLSLSHQVNERLSILLVPAFASNTNFFEKPSEGTFGLGIGGRLMVLNDLSIIAEWIPALAGYKDAANSWGVGLEKKIGGHVFQVFIASSIGMTASQFLPGGDLRLADGDFRLGFNIFRTF